MFQREVNPQHITRADLVVVIPSCCEADSIAHPVRVAAEGLTTYFPDQSAVIINADNASPDGTEQVFLRTETAVPKIYITTPQNTPGKGWNFANAFRRAYALGAKAVVCVDADLISITPEWIRYMAQPILQKGFDYLTPLYARHKYDGTITNNVCYPLIYGIFGRDIRQPIGGDFSLSGRLARHIVSVPWHSTTHQYGVDIFMTMQALLGDFKIGQVGLGSKVHKPSAPKLGPMFFQVVSTAFLTVVETFPRWRRLRRVERPPLLGLKDLGPAQEMEVDRRAIRANALRDFEATRDMLGEALSPELQRRLEETFAAPEGPEIDMDCWVDVLFEMIAAFARGADPERLVEAMRGLYWGRVYSFMNETWELSSAECEQPIRGQGQRVFERRGELIARLEALRRPE